MARTNLTPVTTVIFQATKNGTQAVVTSAKITNLTVNKDTLSNWNAALNRFEVTVAGSYHISQQHSYSGATVGGITAFRINGGTLYYCGTTASNDRLNGSTVIPVTLGIGDYIEFFANPNNSVTLLAGVTDTWFTISKVA